MNKETTNDLLHRRGSQCYDMGARVRENKELRHRVTRAERKYQEEEEEEEEENARKRPEAPSSAFKHPKASLIMHQILKLELFPSLGISCRHLAPKLL